ncbi:hypothetical protein T12_3012 [Trichinella patagoniensis]|uniref:Uncharacterized protein n=1 Tax=Trichinella patagoniensis TaxID=990121 RepID=A0A0V1A3T6_9BILA|nr:hypothetical protein T12_3012 [Trichinella patagoniensis]
MNSICSAKSSALQVRFRRHSTDVAFDGIREFLPRPFDAGDLRRTSVSFLTTLAFDKHRQMIDPNASPVRKQRRYVILIPSERCVRFWMLSATQSLTSQKFSGTTSEIEKNERYQSLVIAVLTVKSRQIIFLEHADTTVDLFFDEKLIFDPTSCSILPAQMIQHFSEELQSPLQRDQFFQIGGLTFSASGLGDQYVIEKTVLTAIRWTVKLHLAVTHSLKPSQVKVVEESDPAQSVETQNFREEIESWKALGLLIAGPL